MDAMAQVRERMHVVGPDGKKLGTVEDFKMGDPEALTADGETNPETDSVIEDSVTEFASAAHLAQHDAERLLRIGYVKIDRRGLFAGHAYVGSDDLDRVEGDTVWLKTALPA